MIVGDTLRFADYSDGDLLAHIGEGLEHLSEIEAEVGSEVALAGDGPPGSAVSIATMRENLSDAIATACMRGLGVSPLPAPCREVASILRHVEMYETPFPGYTVEEPAEDPEANEPPADEIPFLG